MYADDVVLLCAWMESRDAQAFKTLTQRDGETPFVEFEF